MNLCKMKNKAFMRHTQKLLSVMLLGFFICAQLSQVSASGLLGYEAPQSNSSAEAVLYFRYYDTPFLVQETRTLQVPHTKSLQMALVEALIAGPQANNSASRALFPKGTQVIGVLAEGDSLFVTLSKHFIEPLVGENSTTNKEEAVTRRRLALSALSNTLTETGVYQRVQVLVFDQADINASMRLNQRYFLEDSDQIPPPLWRQEEDLITPGRAAEMILGLWQTQNWDQLTGFLAQKPGDALAAQLDKKTLPILLSYSALPGTLAPDMSYALVTLHVEMRLQDGRNITRRHQVVRMLRQNNAWYMNLPSFLQLIKDQTP